jgi:hypothetical protein
LAKVSGIDTVERRNPFAVEGSVYPRPVAA